jgi:ribonuclease J
MRLCIHRGTREIGGTCVELESSGQRVLLDLGLPLTAKDAASTPLPPIAGLVKADPSLLAIILSHGHRDHWGLVPKALASIPIIIGKKAEQIMRAAADFVPEPFAPTASQHLESGKAFKIGPFVIKPHLVDHSGFDAYALEIEADGRRLFYSGDLRAHGNKGKLFEAMLKRPPKNIDVMLMEGSSLGRLKDYERFPTEAAIEQLLLKQFKATLGMVLVACSAQNIDRVVRIYRAAKRSGRTLIIDAYAAEVLKATNSEHIPKPVRGWPNIAVYIPHFQRVQLKEKGIAPIVDSYRGFRLWPKQLAEQASRSVMLVRPWMLRDLDRANAMSGARVIWSQWEGYLNEKESVGAKFKEECKNRNIPFEVIHTSGHASPRDLKRLAKAVEPKILIPIHTFERNRFPALFDNVSLIDDGQWIEV